MCIIIKCDDDSDAFVGILSALSVGVHFICPEAKFSLCHVLRQLWLLCTIQFGCPGLNFALCISCESVDICSYMLI
jgi:hypothetical protein